MAFSSTDTYYENKDVNTQQYSSISKYNKQYHSLTEVPYTLEAIIDTYNMRFYKIDIGYEYKTDLTEGDYIFEFGDKPLKSGTSKNLVDEWYPGYEDYFNLYTGTSDTQMYISYRSFIYNLHTYTYKIRWYPEFFTIINNGKKDVVNGYCKMGEPYTFSAEDKSGYTFQHWSDLNETKTDRTIIIRENNLVLEPIYSPITYTISYNLNGGSLSSGTSNPTTYNIETNEITLVNPTRTGYAFKGWSGTGLTGDSNTSVKIPKGNTGNRTYTANWTPITYTIGYTLDGGSLPSGTSNPTTYNIETNEITLVNPTRTGYTFKGWSGTGLSGDSNKNVKIPKGNTGNRTYTANWTPITYTISYTLNSSNPYTVDTISNPTSYNIETNTITLSNPTRKGYTFKGWSGTGLTGDTNKNVTIPKGSMENRDYTANWIENYIYFEYWSNNRTENNKKFITWKASPQNSSIGWPDNHYDFTASVNKQTYPGYKAKLLKGYSSGGYYNTKPDGSGAYSVHESYNFSSYLDVCDKYGVDYYEPATTIPIYCQWTPEILVSYDTIFNYFDWYRREISDRHGCSISNVTEKGFTITSDSTWSEGTATSPMFSVEAGKKYKIDIDITGNNWDVYIFFRDSAGTWLGTDSNSKFSSSGINPNRIFEAPANTVQAQIRVDANGTNNTVRFENFRIYPADYYYMSYTISETDRSDCGQWSAPANPTRNNNFYKFKHWSKDPGSEGKNTPTTTSGKFPTEDTVLFSQWDKKAPRIFIQEADAAGGKAVPIAQLHNKPIRKAFIYTTDSNKWREC